MHASGFTNAPVTRTLLLGLIVLSILATATDTKHYLPLIPSIHLVPTRFSDSPPSAYQQHPQYFRLATWQLAYLNSSELLFASMTLYKLRVVERLWGSRKFASCIILCGLYTAIIPPVLLGIFGLLLPRTFAQSSVYLPPGPTAIIFVLLAQYHAAIPYVYRYKLASGPAADDEHLDSNSTPGVLLTSKSTSYLLPLQLALSQAPWSLLVAATGWCVGYAWRGEVLPGAAWRLPVGVWSKAGVARLSSSAQRSSGDMDALRGRLRAEVGERGGRQPAAATSSGGGTQQ